MSIRLSSIAPQEVQTLIPVSLQDPNTGEMIMDNIIVYSPTLERMEAFGEEVREDMQNEEILFILIKYFTDIVTDEKDIELLGNFKNYFSEVFDALAIELYRILTIVIKQGIRTREIIADMDEDFLDKLSETGIKEFETIKEFQNAMKKSK